MDVQTGFLKDKIAVVTGAAGGLGSAMCKGLRMAGATVLAVDLPGRRLDYGFGDDGVIETWGDISTTKGAESVIDTAATLGGPDILVNNAGIGMQFINPKFASEPTRFWELEPADWTSAFQANTDSQFFLARLAAPLMLKKGWGRIVNVSTSYATMQLPGFSPYGPSKAAVEAATVIWAKDLAGSGVTVNALLPGGAAATRMITDTSVFPDAAKLVQPEAMVAPLVFLASTRSDGLTGRRFVAKSWSVDAPDFDNLKSSSSPAGWSDTPHPI